MFYVSTVCSSEKFQSIYEKSKIKPQQQAQKFHHLFISALEQLNNKLYVMSVIPVNRNSHKKLWVSEEKEIEGNIIYKYLPFINFPVLKQVFIFIFAFITCLFWSLRKGNHSKVLVCDVLNVTSSVSSLLVSKIFGIKSVAIVTDIPSYMGSYSTKRESIANLLFTNLYNRICTFFIYRYDSFILLTEQMNDVVNPNNKPFVIIEGMADSKMKDIPNKLEEKYEEKIMIYAGALHEKYGVKKLIEAFMKLDLMEARLWLFGSGELEKELTQYELADPRIKYHGVVPNEQVVKEELKASILVNPRSSLEEFTKYSFPSKNMEYMASGTPILTTKLPGMPNEYDEYIYTIENECEEGITLSMQSILSKSKEELYEKGKLSKAFVLREKNNIEQAKRFMRALL